MELPKEQLYILHLLLLLKSPELTNDNVKVCRLTPSIMIIDFIKMQMEEKPKLFFQRKQENFTIF